MELWIAGILGVDAVSMATPLAALKAAIKDTTPFHMDWNIILDVFLGKAGGCIGETSALLLLLGGIFLLWRKIITWHIPVSYMLTVLILTLLGQLIAGHNYMVPIFHLVAGGTHARCFLYGYRLYNFTCNARWGELYSVSAAGYSPS